MSKPEKVKVCILKTTVANKEVVKPGACLELDSTDANILINGKKAKAYEKGDEDKYKQAPKKGAEKPAK